CLLECASVFRVCITSIDLLSFPSFLLVLLLPPSSTLFPYTRSSDLAAFDVAVIEPDHALRTRLAVDLAEAGQFETIELAGFGQIDRKSTRLNSSHEWISYAVFCLKKKKKQFDHLL